MNVRILNNKDLAEMIGGTKYCELTPSVPGISGIIGSHFPVIKPPYMTIDPPCIPLV